MKTVKFEQINIEIGNSFNKDIFPLININPKNEEKEVNVEINKNPDLSQKFIDDAESDFEKDISDNQSINLSLMMNISANHYKQKKPEEKKGIIVQTNSDMKKKNLTKEVIFKITKDIYNHKLFTNVIDNKNEFVFNEVSKRFPKRRNRFKNTDNIRKKIITAFFNNYLLIAINKRVKILGINDYFEKFPTYFIIKKNKAIIMNMTLTQFIKKKELYRKTKDIKNYEHNINTLSSLEKAKNGELKIILNTCLKDLFEAYINSDEFKKEEINRLRKKNMNDWYINRYINLSKNFLKFHD